MAKMVKFLLCDAMQVQPMSSCSVCLSMCLSRSYILSKRINISSNFLNNRKPHHSSFFHTKRHSNILMETPLPRNEGAKCRWGRQKSWFWANIWFHCVLLMLLPAKCCQYDAVSCDTLLVVSSGVCWWQEKTAKCLWQEVSTLRQRQKHYNCTMINL